MPAATMSPHRDAVAAPDQPLHPVSGTARLGVPVPLAGPGTCRLCHGPAALRSPMCWCCRRLARQIGQAPPPLVPVLLYRPGDGAHAVLRGYKDASSPEARLHLVERLVAVLGGFLGDHGACLARKMGRIDALCVVPASPHRPVAGGQAAGAVAPMDTVARRAAQHHATLKGLAALRLVPGPSAARHLHADRHAYVLQGRPHPGTRVLLIDDTWTTGAHLGSAAAALRAGQCVVVGAVVAGRVVEPTASPAVQAWWRHATGAALQDVPKRLLGMPEPCCLPWCPARPGPRARRTP